MGRPLSRGPRPRGGRRRPNFAPMYATRTRKIKTDRRDARALMDANVLGAYRPTPRLSDVQRHVRGRLGVREALVRTRTRFISLIRALLRQHGYRVPSGSAQGFIDRVEALSLPGQSESEANIRHLRPPEHLRPPTTAVPWAAPPGTLT